MMHIDAIQVLRRRWTVVLVVVLVGAAVGWFTAPGERTEPVVYVADTTLVTNAAAGVGLDLEQAALVSTSEPVAQEVVARLGLDGIETARRGVTAKADAETGSLTIQAVRGTSEDASEVAAVFGDALIEVVSSTIATDYQSRLDAASLRAEELQRTVDFLRAVVADDEDPPSQTVLDLEVAERQLADARVERDAIEATGIPDVGLYVLENGRGRVRTSDGIRAPDGQPQRAALIAVFGLLVGIGAAFGLEYLDGRIRDKETAQSAFGAPVLAEVPVLPGGRRAAGRSELIALTDPSSAFVESYRALRTVVVLSERTAEPTDDRSGGEGRIIVVTSAGAGEGKSTTVAHLAAMLAEANRRVLVVSADFRRPRLHEFFGAERDPGLTELVASQGQADVDLRSLFRETAVPNVRLLPSGRPTDNPASLLRSGAEILQRARPVFDFLIVDTPPVLVANDASELIQVADDVILVARSGRTTIDAAKRATEVLGRVNAPLLGTVLVGAAGSRGTYSYYRSGYYSDTPRGRSASRGRRAGAARAPGVSPETLSADLAEID